ncbi:ROK family transcriptional regulator [Actinomyces gerencseriae]|uniref:ROK family transcriptional regulator n=1 Tax=Actinomyces gerencseriae TaxID=52769 RepID=UPI001FE1280F|nr:ROK family transcriptional regulator [Actinomyces gerencseriae]
MTSRMGVGPERIREINSLQILHWLIDGEEVTATEIAEHCDLSRTSVNAALADLREMGWITRLNAVTGVAGGRPARRYRFRGGSAVVLGADIDVRHVKVLIADLSGTALAQRSRPVEPDLDPSSRLAVLDRLITEALAQAGLEADDVHALTVAVNGAVDESGRTPFFPPLPEWHEVDLVTRLKASFACPVRISNSCKLALLAEAQHGRIAGIDDAVYILILADHRIGAAIMNRGEVIEGSAGVAGEIGGLKILRWKRAIQDLTAHPSMPELTDERERIDWIVRAARDGDGEALSCMRTYARDLATGAAALVLAADPAVLVLGGDLSLSSDLWLEHFTRALERLVLHMPSIRVSTIGDDAVVRGAARRATLDVRDRYFGDYLLPAPIAPTSSTS